ncbi:MAG: hypothetical protein M3Z20_12020 [Chloroflexota bacterium]|nr:hypothetical protein [Chloroflexota bacterium]
MTNMQNDHNTSAPLPLHAPVLAEGEALEGVNVPNPKLILQITLEREDVRLLAEPAQAANMPMGRYIKQVALAAARAYQDEQAKQAS